MKFHLLIDARLFEVNESAALEGELAMDIDRDSCPRLTFDKGILSIDNPFWLRCDSGERVGFSSIVGCQVSDSFSNETEFVIVFEGKIFLTISLREEDFIGPYAAVYRAFSGEIVVFSVDSFQE